MSLVVRYITFGTMGSLYVNCRDVSSTKISYIHWKSGAPAIGLKNEKVLVKRQLDGGYVERRKRQWVDYFNMTILYLSNPHP